MQAGLPEHVHHAAAQGDPLIAPHDGHEYQQMAIDRDKEQRRQLTEKAGKRTALRAAGRVKEARKVQPHLQTNQLACQLRRRKNEPDGKADAQADQDFVNCGVNRVGPVQWHNRLVQKNATGTPSHQQRQADTNSHGQCTR